MKHRLLAIALTWTLLAVVSLPATAAEDPSSNPVVAGWERMPLVGARPVHRLFTPSSGALVAWLPGRLFRSDDVGVIWFEIPIPLIVSERGLEGNRRVAVAPSNAEVIYVTGVGGLLKTEDGGNTWRVVYPFPDGPNGGHVLQIAVSPVDDDLVFFELSQVPAPVSPRLFRSQDGGAVWTELPLPPANSACSARGTLQPHPSDPNRLFLVESCRTRTDGVWHSGDQGLTWKRLFDRAEHLDVSPGALFLDGGYSVLPDRLYFSVGRLGGPTDPAAAYSVPFFRSDDDGRMWTHRPTLTIDHGEAAIHGRLRALAVDPSAPDCVYVALEFPTPDQSDGNATVLRVKASPDGGLTWTDLGEPPSQEPSGRASLSLISDGRYLVVTRAHGLWRLPLVSR